MGLNSQRNTKKHAGPTTRAIADQRNEIIKQESNLLKGNKDMKHKGSKDTLGPTLSPRGRLRFFPATQYLTRSLLHSSSSLLHFTSPSRLPAILLRSQPFEDRNITVKQLIQFVRHLLFYWRGLHTSSAYHPPSRSVASLRVSPPQVWGRDLRVLATSAKSATTALCCTDIGYLSTPVSAD